MELKDFIRGTLEEIVGALSEFEESDKNYGATAFTEIYTKGESAAQVGILKAQTTKENSNRPTVIAINFDVAVTIEAEGIKMAEGGLKIPGVGGAGGSGKQTDKNKSVNRMTFAVPIELPVTKERRRKKPAPKPKTRSQSSSPNSWMRR